MIYLRNLSLKFLFSLRKKDNELSLKEDSFMSKWEEKSNVVEAWLSDIESQLEDLRHLDSKNVPIAQHYIDLEVSYFKV